MQGAEQANERVSSLAIFCIFRLSEHYTTIRPLPYPLTGLKYPSIISGILRIFDAKFWPFLNLKAQILEIWPLAKGLAWVQVAEQTNERVSSLAIFCVRQSWCEREREGEGECECVKGESQREKERERWYTSDNPSASSLLLASPQA